MDWQNHIVASADTCVGKPRIKGTRITVELLLNWFAAGWTEKQILEAYPHINAEQVRAAVAFASSRVGRDAMLPRASASG